MRILLLMMSSAVAVVWLSACGEKPQTRGGVTGDVAPYQSADSRFTVPGWKTGDKTSWEQALKARANNTQNEYTKTMTK